MIDDEKSMMTWKKKNRHDLPWVTEPKEKTNSAGFNWTLLTISTYRSANIANNKVLGGREEKQNLTTKTLVCAKARPFFILFFRCAPSICKKTGRRTSGVSTYLIIGSSSIFFLLTKQTTVLPTWFILKYPLPETNVPSLTSIPLEWIGVFFFHNWILFTFDLTATLDENAEKHRFQVDLEKNCKCYD